MELRGVHTAHDIVRHHHATLTQKLNQVQFLRQCRCDVVRHRAQCEHRFSVLFLIYYEFPSLGRTKTYAKSQLPASNTESTEILGRTGTQSWTGQVKRTLPRFMSQKSRGTKTEICINNQTSLTPSFTLQQNQGFIQPFVSGGECETVRGDHLVA